MAKVQARGFTRIYRAFFYSMKGFKAGFINEAAVRQEFVLALILTPCAFFVASSISSLLWLTVMPWLTLAFELMNSAIEAVVDRIGLERHELSGRAKDLGSACVFVLLILTLLVWGIAIAECLGWSFGK
ncbi:MAG: diacylglycerol kinase [Succinatimonas sp.]|nr:diacylglycerol kinase [Succinatimonas sp.]